MSNTLKFGNGEWYGKEGTILAYNDENNNYKPLPFTFDRDSVATRVNKQGLIETVGADQPRIDYLNDSNGALLLEPSRTNSLLQSNQFDTTWTIGASALDLTSGQSGVFGSNDAWLLKKNTDGARYIQQSLSLSSAQYSYSVYLKSESTNWAFIWAYDGAASVNAYFDLENGVVGQTGGSALDGTNIESVGNGWYRCTLIYTHAPDLIRIYPANSNGNTSTGADNGIYIQHAQLEVSYATSIINTQGSAVTRLADSCNNGGNEQVINSTEGVLYAEISALDSSNIFDFGLYGNTSTNQCRIGFFNDDVYASLYNGSFQTQMSAPSNLSDFTKIAFKFSENDFALWIDGNEVATDTSGTTFNSGDLVKLNLSAQNGTSSLVTGNVKDVRVYDTALTDQELAALTQV